MTELRIFSDRNICYISVIAFILYIYKSLIRSSAFGRKDDIIH